MSVDLAGWRCEMLSSSDSRAVHSERSSGVKSEPGRNHVRSDIELKRLGHAPTGFAEMVKNLSLLAEEAIHCFKCPEISRIHDVSTRKSRNRADGGIQSSCPRTSPDIARSKVPVPSKNGILGGGPATSRSPRTFR